MKRRNTDKLHQVDYLGSRTSRLQEIVDILDSGARPLDELVALYEEGIKLSKECKEYLVQIEGRIIDIASGIIEDNE